MDSNHSHAFVPGKRVRAARRPGFPHGIVLQLLDHGYVLVQWDGDALETAHHEELAPAEESG